MCLWIFFCRFIINKFNTIDYATELEKIVNQRNPSFILVVVLNERQDLYNVIKRKLCVDGAGKYILNKLKPIQSELCNTSNYFLNKFKIC